MKQLVCVALLCLLVGCAGGKSDKSSSSKSSSAKSSSTKSSSAKSSSAKSSSAKSSSAKASGAKKSSKSGAIGALKTVSTSNSLFKDGDLEGEDDGTLTELEDADLIDSVLGSGTKKGYRFTKDPDAPEGGMIWYTTKPEVEGKLPSTEGKPR